MYQEEEEQRAQASLHVIADAKEWDSLPIELWYSILNDFLPPCMLAIARVVCKGWDNLIRRLPADWLPVALVSSFERRPFDIWEGPNSRLVTLAGLSTHGYVHCIRSLYLQPTSPDTPFCLEALVRATEGGHLETFEVLCRELWPYHKLDMMSARRLLSACLRTETDTLILCRSLRITQQRSTDL